MLPRCGPKIFALRKMCHWMRQQRGKEFKHWWMLCFVECSKLPREGNEEVDTLLLQTTSDAVEILVMAQ
ncbi:hypothetical protein, conserved [Eimeria tenella]|uniref:Uncharacterized protein n=1 Tax=Eimeria tenella TaxID=5802 RepID=U6KYL1_EIMTE|nr:hypothetical protein, conserved [Eimeria tenella]CDJ43046.1 hypothetical protein, conserved [Eimeria tenella]|eukprot:XP_013233796.1 hypothetical protein, conserved [Eimeria tenella]